MKKAFSLDKIDQAVLFNEPIGPDHPFYTDFSRVRGDFEERIIYRILNVKVTKGIYTYDYIGNRGNKTLFFLGGMRGSGKTSELAKYVKNMNHPDCFFCVTCNIDEELDMNDIEYMDILIFQLEKLTQLLQMHDIKVNKGTVASLQRWFERRVTEINTSIKGEAGIEIGTSAKIGGFWSILEIFGTLKAGVSGSKERASSIRTILKNRFSDFAVKFNEFIEESNLAIRQAQKGQEILFIIDGLEKTMSLESRRKIILEESNRLKQIRANTIFTLPIELMKERAKISMFSTVETFPFVKILDRTGQPQANAISKFLEFVYKRIAKHLFENEEVVLKAISYGGGSPRELLRILETANFYADEEKGKIDDKALTKALHRLAALSAQYLTKEKLEKLKEIKENNEQGLDTPFDEIIQEMLEDIVVMEYNDGTYKRVNPILELSNLYQQRVGI